MKFGVGSPRLSDMVNGVLGAGIVPIGRMMREKPSAKNAALVTVLAANTTIVTLALQSVNPNDLILVSSRVEGTKGLTAGNTDFVVGKDSGVATFFTYNDKLLANTRVIAQPASSVCIETLVAILAIFGGGSLTLGLIGASAGSNLSVAAGEGQIEAMVLRA